MNYNISSSEDRNMPKGTGPIDSEVVGYKVSKLFLNHPGNQLFL